MLRNLAVIWPNYRNERIRYLVLARVNEDRNDLHRYREAIPEADIQVVRVVAPPELVQERLGTERFVRSTTTCGSPARNCRQSSKARG
jgi:hypothetical protein